MTSKEFTEQILSMSTDLREKFLEAIKTQLSEEDYKVIVMHFALENMFRHPAKYEAMKNAVCDQLCEEFYGHRVERKRKVEDACNPVYMTTIL